MPFDGTVSLGLVPQILWRHKGKLLACVVLGAALGATFLYVAEPVYEVQARLLVQRQGMPLEEKNSSIRWEKEFIATQAEVLGSSAVVARAVEAQGLNITADGDNDPLLPILAGLEVAPVLGTDVVNIKLVSKDPAQAQRLILSIVDSYHEYLRQNEKDSHSESLRMLTESEKELREDLAMRERQYIQLREGSPLLGGRGADGVAIQVAEVDLLAKTLQEVISRRMELENLLPVMEQASLSAQMPKVEARLVTLKVPVDQEGVDAGPANSDAATEVAASFRHEAQLTLMPRFSEHVLLPREVVSLHEELSRARAEEAALAANYGSRHPSVQAAREQVLAWETRLYEHVKMAPTVLKQELTGVQQHEQQLKQLYHEKLAAAKAVDGHLIREQQALDGIARAETMHASLLTQIQQWQLAEKSLAGGSKRISARLLEEPTMPLEATWPDPLLVMATSVFLGMCAGGGLALLAESTSRPPRSIAPA
jgi:uncharacterized protein involved in exopolysaccharide biosynthesis